MVFLFVLLIIYVVFANMILFNKSFSLVLPFSLLFIISFIYLFGLIGNLLFGIFLIVLFCLIHFFYLFFYKKIDIILSIKESLLSDPSFYLFIILFIVIFYYNKNNYFTSPDEWSHWGPYLKDMFIRNKFYNTEGHIATHHLSYPPFAQIFEYFYVKIMNVLSMPNLYRSYQLLCFSLYFPFLDNLKFDKKNKNNIKTIILSTLILLYLILTNRLTTYNANPVNSIVTDSLLGLLFGYYLINILNFDILDNFKFINLILSGIAVVLTKQIGAAIYLVLITIFLFTEIYNKNINKQTIFKYLLIVFIPLLFYMSWKFVVFSNSVTDQFDINRRIDFNKLYEILFLGGGEPFQKTVTKNFIDWIFNKRLIIMTPIQWFLSYIIVLIITVILFFKKYENKLLFNSIGSILGLILYMFGLLCMYYFTFDLWETEAIELASIWRYTTTYLLGITYLINYIYINYFIENKKYKILSLISIILVLGLSFSLYISNEYKTTYLPKKEVGYNDAKIRFDNLLN